MEKLVCKGKGQGYEWGREKKKKKNQQISPLALERDEKRDAGNCEGKGALVPAQLSFSLVVWGVAFRTASLTGREYSSKNC